MDAPNPFTPPGADLTPPAASTRGPAWKAILLGFIADVTFTIVVGIVFTLAYGFFLAASGTPPDEVKEALGSANPDAFYTVMMLGIGGAGSFLGGYLCARIAKHREYTLVTILLVISLLLGWAITPEETTAAMILMETVVTIALTPAGAWLGVRKNRMGR